MQRTLKSRTPGFATRYRPSTETERAEAQTRRNMASLIRWTHARTRSRREQERGIAARQTHLLRAYIARRATAPTG